MQVYSPNFLKSSNNSKLKNFIRTNLNFNKLKINTKKEQSLSPKTSLINSATRKNTLLTNKFNKNKRKERANGLSNDYKNIFASANSKAIEVFEESYWYHSKRNSVICDDLNIPNLILPNVNGKL